MIISSNVIGTPTDTAYNNLRADLVTNHKHTGSDGSRILHDDLIYPDGYQVLHSHEEIDEHLDVTKGIHGLNDIVSVAGGSETYNEILTGWWKNDSPYMACCSYPLPYDKTKSFFVPLSGNNDDRHTTMVTDNYRVVLGLTCLHQHFQLRVSTRYTTGFYVSARHDRYDYEIKRGDISFFWLVIGKVASW